MKKLMVLECTGKKGKHIRVWAYANLGRKGDITSKQWFNLKSFATHKGLELNSVITVGVNYESVYNGIDFAKKPVTLSDEHLLRFGKYEMKGKYFREIV